MIFVVPNSCPSGVPLVGLSWIARLLHSSGILACKSRMLCDTTSSRSSIDSWTEGGRLSDRCYGGTVCDCWFRDIADIHNDWRIRRCHCGRCHWWICDNLWTRWHCRRRSRRTIGNCSLLIFVRHISLLYADEFGRGELQISQTRRVPEKLAQNLGYFLHQKTRGHFLIPYP